MKLMDAVLCMDCEEIATIGTGSCPSCASQELQRLTMFIPSLETENDPVREQILDDIQKQKEEENE